MTRKYTPCKSNKKQFSGGGSIVARESADSTTTQECRSADESRGSNPQEECRGTPAVDIGRECLQILVASEISGPTRCIHSPHKKSHSIACLNYHLSPHQLPSPHPFHHGTYHTTPAGDIGKECLQMLSVSETSRPSTRRIHSERRKSHSCCIHELCRTKPVTYLLVRYHLLIHSITPLRGRQPHQLDGELV